MTQNFNKLIQDESDDVFAVFAVVRSGEFIWCVTRDGKDIGKFGLLGGKLDQDESPLKGVIRESYEEGLILYGTGKFLRRDYVDGNLIYWYEFPTCAKLNSYKEQSRGIIPVMVHNSYFQNSEYGNEFLFKG